MFHDFYPMWASLTPTLFCILRFSAPMRWCCRLSSRRAVGTHHLCLRGSFRSHKARARVTTKPHAWMSRQEFHGGPYSLHAGEPRRVGSHGDGHTAQHLKGNVFVSNVRLHLAVLLIVSEWRRIVVKLQVYLSTGSIRTQVHRTLCQACRKTKRLPALQDSEWLVHQDCAYTQIKCR